ncbi:ornithine cyclodeaminase family protein [Nocardia vulneris]|uniref:ornithine cyclodeaminase family protein n=1 Tax=Nocardia vulneris TaxID=1141657 RepID=UPI0030D07AC1
MSEQSNNTVATHSDLEVRYLSRRDVIELGITAAEILDHVRDALVEHGQGRYEMPAKIGVHPHAEVFYHAMPAYVPSRSAVGCKWIECYPNNPREHGLPQTTGLMIINDPDTGLPLAVLDATWVTAVRTPAVTMLAARALHPDARTFGMFGCGAQGIEHVRYAGEALPGLETVTVFDTDPAAAQRLIDELTDVVPFRLVVGESVEAVVKSCEVLSSATVILKEPLAVAKSDWVGPGQTILPCDLNTFWDPVLAERADKYIVDSIDEHELFARLGYFPGGLPEISCETGAVVAGAAIGREHRDQVIVNSNIGMAVCDVVVGKAVHDLAVARGIGTLLPL